MKQDFDWIKIATEKFHEYRVETQKYTKERENIPELAWIAAGKAVALSELLEMVGCKPKPK